MQTRNSEHCCVASPPQSHLGRVRCYPSRQRMHLPAACASCAMSTADKSSYSATSTLHPDIDTTSVPWHIGPQLNHNLYHNPI